ncbi:hypothetical protein K461DRAFT_324421 [Myriangium duriaei CBS 260.36]|uniref:Protein BCP1 n=1 Tax=Myriangium duriaei CBS 260.36 TaxID=1168546 RepID=A0A9P4IW93_9PEZI|nr:hypothetical protein K461DRAFT_324421 [Myriangium duriaei CBS 260.36]
MGKRKAAENGHAGSDDSGSDDDISMLDVDFEFFSPAEIDFHGLKSLLRQLFDSDAESLDLSGLADLIISQPSIGSTVKCDGEESDPFAFLTVLSLHDHASNPVIASLVSYLSSRSATNPALAQLTSLLSSSDANVALVLGERLINMPTAVVPALYTMLTEELPTPVPYTHFLVLSKTYAEVASTLPSSDRPSKKSRPADSEETFYFHAEDEALARVAEVSGGWDYARVDEGASDARRAFQDAGIRPRGFALLVKGERWGEAVEVVGKYLGQE